MKKALTIGLVAAALAAVPVDAVVAQNTASVPSYDRGPRIIIVPQALERDRVNSRASVDTNVTEDDDDVAPPRRNTTAPSVRTTPRWGAQPEPRRIEKPYVAPPPRRVETPATHEPLPEKRTVRHIDMSKPKAEPAAEPVPQPPSPRRAVLSAPPMPAEGPTPIRPTPRFDSKIDSKFGAKAEAPTDAPSDAGETPPPAEITADQPPPGYTPPAKRSN
jgi:hypothetical protein